MTAIVVEHLRKQYGQHLVVDDLSFTVAAGEVFALLGPNGAGKTTTIEILEGYRSADAGSVRVLSLDPWRDAARLRPQIGLMLQEGGVYPQARPREIVQLLANFYPTPDDPDRLLTLVGLNDALRTPYRRLSGGQKQRLSLALALIGRPRLVFLDEPTVGMDPQARRATWQLIRELRADGVTLLLTTQAMEEAEQLADRLAIIDRGRLVALGDLASLRGGHGQGVRLVTARPLTAAERAELERLASVDAVTAERADRYQLQTSAPPTLLVELTAWAAQQGVPIHELRVGGESLEEIFLRLTHRTRAPGETRTA